MAGRAKALFIKDNTALKFDVINMKTRKLKRAQIFLYFTSVLFAAAGFCTASHASDFPDLISSLKMLEQTPQFCGERVPLDIQEVRERFEKEFLLMLWNRPQVILWLKRTGRYFPYIEKMLQESGMPEDLKYVAVIESALRLHARSHKGAVGFWQFMPHTGRKYGLVVNRRLDERRNLFAATQAAIDYFKELHELLGSWTLAAAAYNMGEEGLMAEMMEQKMNDYYRLYLPLETQRFLFRILAAKSILSAPAKFGFVLAERDYYRPMAFDRIKIDSVNEVPVRVLAAAAETHFKAIKDLNPDIRGHYLISGSHTILVPKGAGEGFHLRYKALLQQEQVQRKERVYIVQKGDNLSMIAEKFGVPLNAIIIWNRLDIEKAIHPGERLIVYPQRGDTLGSAAKK